MVDTNSNLNVLTQDIVAAEDRTRMESAAEMWVSNIQALIKLRQKGVTKVSKLPKGVFRCILEYQFPNELRWRYSEPFLPIQCQQDRHFPAIDKLDYNNHLVAINEIDNNPEY